MPAQGVVTLTLSLIALGILFLAIQKAVAVVTSIVAAVISSPFFSVALAVVVIAAAAWVIAYFWSQIHR